MKMTLYGFFAPVWKALKLGFAAKVADPASKLRTSPVWGKPTLLTKLPLPNAEAQKALAAEGGSLSPFLQERLRHLQEQLAGSAGIDALAATSADLVSWLCKDPDIRVATAPPKVETAQGSVRSKAAIYDDFFQCARLVGTTAESAAIALSAALGAIVHEWVEMEKETPAGATERSLLISGFETLADVILEPNSQTKR